MRRLVDYTPSYYASPALATFKTALENVANAPVRITTTGSSTMAGSNALTREKRWLSLFEKELQRRHAPNGRGGVWIGATAFTTSGTVTTVNKGIGLRARSLTQTASISMTYGPITAVTVLYAEGNNAQPFSVQIGSNDAETITPATGGAERWTGVFTTAAVTRGRYTVTITATNACKVNGAHFHDGDHASGVQVYNGGLGGSTADDFTDASLAEMIGAVGPALNIYMIGANDFAADRNPVTYKSDVAGMIDDVDALVTTSHLLVQTYQRIDVTDPTYAWSLYGDKLEELADERDNVFYLDISATYPLTQEADTLNLIDTDDIHQTDTGHSRMARLIAEGLR